MLFATPVPLPPIVMEMPIRRPSGVQAAIANFGNELCARISMQEGANKSFAISPASMIAALGMCLHVIAPEYKQQFLARIHLGHLTETQAHQAIAGTLQQMPLPKDFAGGAIRVAQALGYKPRAVIADALVQFLSAAYGAETIVSEDLMQPLNAWVDAKTEGKIPTILSNNYAEFVLLNALYLNLQWQTPFHTPQEGWQKESFLCSDGTTAPAIMMKQTERFSVYRGPKFDMLEKPYLSPQGRTLSQCIILPRNPQDLGEIEAEFTDAAIRQCRQEARVEPSVALSLPKIKMETELHLLDILAEMGLPLHAIDRTLVPHLSIDEIIHKTFVSVDEKGTEAAAVSAAAMCGCAMIPRPPTVFDVRHSYMYYILDGDTVLFRGRVADAGPLIF